MPDAGAKTINGRWAYVRRRTDRDRLLEQAASRGVRKAAAILMMLWEPTDGFCEAGYFAW